MVSVVFNDIESLSYYIGFRQTVLNSFTGKDAKWPVIGICFGRFSASDCLRSAAMLPLLRAEVAEKNRWVTDEELLDYYSIGQCTPGIIAINTATFVGYKLRGVTGAVLTTFGVVAPSIIIITLIAAVLQNFMYDSHVTQAFAGIRIVVVALVAEAVVELWKKGVHGRIGLAVFVLSLFLLVFLHFSPIAVILTASVIGPAYLKWVRK